MSTLKPITDELINEAKKIVEKRTKQKEQYLKAELGGSISDKGVYSMAKSLYGSCEFDDVLLQLRFVPWDGFHKLTDEQILNLCNCNPKIKAYINDDWVVTEWMQDEYDNPGSDTEDQVEFFTDEDGLNVFAWEFKSKEVEDDFFITHLRRIFGDSDLDSVENINSYEDLYKVLSEAQDFPPDCWRQEA